MLGVQLAASIEKKLRKICEMKNIFSDINLQTFLGSFMYMKYRLKTAYVTKRT
jgi:hypothetical protein